MKAIYYNIFGLGHINPTLPLVSALKEIGVEVIYHSSPERREVIESAGAIFANYGYDEYKASDFNPGKNFVLQTIPATLGLLPFLMAEFERVKPDFILYDSMAIWGSALAQIYKVPAFCTVTTFALNDNNKRETFLKHNVSIDEINLKAISDLKDKYDVELSLLDTLGAYTHNNIVFTARDFNPEVGSHPFFFCGAMISKNHQEFPFSELNKNKKLLTMAFGTILLKEDPSLLRFYKMLIEAFSEDESYQIILAVGSDENFSLLGEIPSNVMVFSKIPQIEVLKYTDCFITHGGMNSINEALYFGVPLLVLPHSHDQFVNAQRVVDLNLGHSIPMKEVAKDILKKEILKLLADQEITKNLKKMSSNFKECDGLNGILNYIKDRI